MTEDGLALLELVDSTSPLGRRDEEIKRRAHAAGVFPNEAVIEDGAAA